MNLTEPIPVHEWMADATCLKVGRPDDWFPRTQRDEATAQQAKQACKRFCPVREQCLSYALSQEGGVEGIWGGLDALERRQLLGGRGPYAVKKICRSRGHDLTLKNAVYVRPSDGARICRRCKELNAQAQYDRSKGDAA